MAEKCIRCGIDGRDVKLFNGIYYGRMERICERCAIIENIPLIKSPNPNQLKDSERSSAYNRIKRGVIPYKKDTVFIEDKLKELDENPELETPDNKLNFIDNFHWHIMKERRRKKLTQKQLGDSLGESEVIIKMIESGKLPVNAEVLIKKLEQFFQIRLKKKIQVFEEEKPILLDENGEELEKIPEPEFEIIEEEIEEPKPETKSKEFKEIDIKEVNPKAVTIADLRELNRRRIEASKKEKIEEQRRIEERQRLIEARKEELRLLKEKESKDLDRYLKGDEVFEN